jgi:hypothetical protein
LNHRRPCPSSSKSSSDSLQRTCAPALHRSLRDASALRASKTLAHQIFAMCPSDLATADVPLQKRTRADGRCPARTGDLLLVRREHLLPSTAVCHSCRSASDERAKAAALCCGLSLPSCFHVVALPRCESISGLESPRHGSHLSELRPGRRQMGLLRRGLGGQ